MKTHFIANFLLLIFVNALVKPLYVFGIEMRVQDVVSEAEYGRFFDLFNFGFLFYIVLDLGLTQYNSRIIAQEPERIGEYMPNFFMAKAMFGGAFFILLYMSAWVLGYGAGELWLLFPIATIHFLNSLMDYLRSNMGALHLFRLDAVLSVANRLMLVAICGWMLYTSFSEQFKLEYFLYAQVGTLSLICLLTLGLTLPHLKGRRLIFDKKLLWDIIKRGYPYALLVLLTTVYLRIDAVMISKWIPGELGECETAYYAAAFRYWDMAVIIGALMATQLLPMFARHIRLGEHSEVRKLTMTGFRSVMVMSVALAVGISHHSEALIEMNLPSYPREYVGLILSFLIFSIIPYCSSYVFNTLMNANANLRTLNIIGCIGVLLNVTLNLSLIPKYGALGAAGATLLTQTLAALGHIVYANRHLELNLPLSMFLRIPVYGGLMHLVFTLLMPALPLHWMAQLVLGGALSLPVAWGVGILDLGMLQRPNA